MKDPPLKPNELMQEKPRNRRATAFFGNLDDRSDRSTDSSANFGSKQAFKAPQAFVSEKRDQGVVRQSKFKLFGKAEKKFEIVPNDFSIPSKLTNDFQNDQIQSF